jgi:hypothetical protein
MTKLTVTFRNFANAPNDDDGHSAFFNKTYFCIVMLYIYATEIVIC